MDFDELLAQYKANPRRESAALLLQDRVLLKYCVIWRQVPVERTNDFPIEATWSALWECVTVNLKTIAMLADDEEVKARKTIERLKGLRLVFPDGSIQELAEKVIVKTVTDALR